MLSPSVAAFTSIILLAALALQQHTQHDVSNTFKLDAKPTSPAHRIIILLPSHGFDPTEVAVPFHVWTQLKHEVIFATPDGKPSSADAEQLRGLIGGLIKVGVPVLFAFVAGTHTHRHTDARTDAHKCTRAQTKTHIDTYACRQTHRHT